MAEESMSFTLNNMEEVMSTIYILNTHWHYSCYECKYGMSTQDFFVII